MNKTIQTESLSIPGQFEFFGQPFPLVLQCQSADASIDDICRWVADQAAEFNTKAAEHGVILFRDFPINHDQDFDRFVSAFGLENFAYKDSLSNAVRVNRTERVFTANEAPPEVTIFLHHEMAQTPIFPSKLFFYCEQAAESGGATPVCRSDALWEQIQQQTPEFATACATKGLKYSNVMPGSDDPESGMGRSWQSTWRADSRAHAEANMLELGYTWEWLEDGSLRATTPVLPAVHDLGGGRKSFFNQLLAAYQGWKDERNDPSKAITHGDGSPLDKDAVAKAIELAEQCTFDVPWQGRDVALIDNYVAMHGRRTFTGTRRILASLIAANA